MLLLDLCFELQRNRVPLTRCLSAGRCFCAASCADKELVIEQNIFGHHANSANLAAAPDPRIAAALAQTRVSSKPRKVLSEEEKEERRERRKENEKKRLELQKKEKAERKARLWKDNGTDNGFSFTENI